MADERPTKPGLRRPSMMGVQLPAREVDVRMKRDSREDPSSCPPSPSEDERQAARSMRVRAHEPPVWLVALGKWLAPLLTPVFLALGMWAQAKASEARAQADAAAAEAREAAKERAASAEARAAQAKRLDDLAAENARLCEQLEQFERRLGQFDEDWTDFLRSNPSRSPPRRRSRAPP